MHLKNSSERKKGRSRKVTHLYANDAFLDAIGNWATSKHLKVIYLQNNNISKIENLHLALNTTHLYLQHNKITKIENLDLLKNLQKLYLGYNSINVIEGLENQRNLRELHIENQKLTNSDSLCIEPRTARALTNCLQVLNISGNRIRTFKEIRNLCEVRILEAKNNLIEDMEELVEAVNGMPNLKELYLQGNPVTQQRGYRENLIASGNRIETLDGRIVHDVCRRFMKSLKLETHSRRTRKKPVTSLGDDITNSLNLPPAFQRSISRAIFQYPGQSSSMGLICASGEAAPRVFPSWNSVLAARTIKDNRVVQRPFRRSVVKKEACFPEVAGKKTTISKVSSVAVPNE